MYKRISLFIVSASLAVACSSSSQQSYYEETSDVQDSTEVSTEVQEPIKRDPDLPNGKNELSMNMHEAIRITREYNRNIKYYLNSPEGFTSGRAKHFKKLYDKQVGANMYDLIKAYDTYREELYDLFNKSEVEEDERFYHKEIKRLEESWEELIAQFSQFNEAIEEAITD